MAESKKRSKKTKPVVQKETVPTSKGIYYGDLPPRHRPKS